MESSKVASAVLVVLWLHSVTSQTMSESADLTFACPPWFIPTLQENGTVTCTCGGEIEDIVRCDQSNLQVTLRLSTCMTFDTETNETFVGSRPLSQAENSTTTFILLPRNLSDLNEFMCDGNNREGHLCGRCKPGYSSTILTYGGPCVNCTGKESTSWIVFLAITIIPVTLFYFVFLFFVSVNVLSPYLNAFVLFAQLVTIPGNFVFLQIVIGQVVDVDDKLVNFSKINILDLRYLELGFSTSICEQAVSDRFLDPCQCVLFGVC